MSPRPETRDLRIKARPDPRTIPGAGKPPIKRRPVAVACRRFPVLFTREQTACCSAWHRQDARRPPDRIRVGQPRPVTTGAVEERKARGRSPRGGGDSSAARAASASGTGSRMRSRKEDERGRRGRSESERGKQKRGKYTVLRNPGGIKPYMRVRNAEVQKGGRQVLSGRRGINNGGSHPADRST